MSPIRAHSAALAAVLAFAGCSAWERVPHDYPGRVGGELDHRRWTREARIYESLETVALISSSLLSPAMQGDLRLRLDAEVPGRASLDQLGFALPTTQASVLVIISGRRRGWEMLGGGESPWAIELEAGGRTAVPVDVRPVQPPVTFERWFPSWNPWSRAWLLAFPLPNEALDGPTRLRFAAAGGIRADFVWP